MLFVGSIHSVLPIAASGLHQSDLSSPERVSFQLTWQEVVDKHIIPGWIINRSPSPHHLLDQVSSPVTLEVDRDATLVSIDRAEIEAH